MGSRYSTGSNNNTGENLIKSKNGLGGHGEWVGSLISTDKSICQVDNNDNGNGETNLESTSSQSNCQRTNGRHGFKYRPQTRHTSLTLRDIEFLSTQTDLSPEQVGHIYDEFYKSCKYNDRLTMDQFKHLYKQFMGIEKTGKSIDHIIEHIFRAFDHDRSGYIEFGEFLVGFAIASRGDLETRLSYAFDCYDADYSEYIEQDEIEPVLRAMMKMLGFMHVHDFRVENMIKDLMQIADVSNDGRLSKTEFIQALVNDEFVRGMLNPFN